MPHLTPQEATPELLAAIVDSGTVYHDGLTDSWAVALVGGEQFTFSGFDHSALFSITADAPTKAAYAAILAEEALGRDVAALFPSEDLVYERDALDRADAAYRAAQPAAGKRLKVVKGRKVPLGFEGICAWFGYTKFGACVGFDTPQGRIFTSASNVQVVA